MAYLIILIVILLAWMLWLTLTSGSLRQINAGARLFQEKRYPEAKAHFQRLLTRRLSAGVEANTRRRLADTFDILGRTEEAAAERERANAAVLGKTRDPMAIATQGDLLRREHHYNEACKMYERALALISPVASAGQAHIMAKLTLAHFGAGRSGEALKWAKAALASRPTKDIRRMMESMAGITSADQGDLEDAESHHLRAVALAETSGKPEEVSRSLASLAGIQYKRGQFEQAILACRRAWDANPEPGRIALITEIECLRDWGRFDEARTVALRFRQGPKHDQPWVERKHQALGSLAAAYIEIFAGQPATALPFLEEAREGLKVAASASVWPPPITGDEDKVVVWCDAAMAAALAGVERKEEAEQLLRSVQRRLLNFGNDRATLLGTYGSLGRAAFALGDLTLSEEFWRRYLDCKPNPVSLPNAYFYLGEIHLRRAERNAAHEAFTQALAPGVDSFYARRAQVRLEELGG